jgi:hypothetical protein
MILPKSDLITIPHYPFNPYMSSLHSPEHSFPKRRGSNIWATKKDLACLKSTIFLQIEFEFKWYLNIQALNRARFRLLILGIPKPPFSFFLCN